MTPRLILAFLTALVPVGALVWALFERMGWLGIALLVGWLTFCACFIWAINTLVDWAANR